MTFLNFTIPNSSPMISYQGQWEDGPINNSSTCANQSISLQLQGTPSLKTNDGHAAATLAFLGTNITIYGETDNVFSVQLDKESLITVNGSHFWHDTSPSFLWSADNSNDTEHTVTISQLSSGGKLFNLDCISIGRDIGPPGYNGSISNMTIDDESSFIVYTGSWTSSFSNSAYNNSIHSTSTNGSRAELEFRGSSIELYGNGASFQIQVDNQLPMNLIGSQFDMSQSQGGPPGGLRGRGSFPHLGPPGSSQAGDPNSQSTGSTLLFYTDNLDRNRTHVITLTNSQSNSPLFLDFAVIRGAGDQSVSAITPSPTLMTPNSTQNPDDSNSKSIPIGAIIGGVIGGIVGLILIGVIAFIFVRRSRHNYGLSTEGGNDVRSGPQFGETPVGQPLTAMSFATDTAYGYNSSVPKFENDVSIPSLPVQHNYEPFPVPTAI